MTGDEGHGIDDGGMARLGKCRGDAHLLAGQRVGRIDDARRGLSALDEGESRAHVLGANHRGLQILPLLQALERRLGVTPGRHAVGIAHGELAAVECGREIVERCRRRAAR